MRRLLLTAPLAVLLLLASSHRADANPPDCRGFGCGGFCLRMFPSLLQEGPLFNYGPYYGYYPFKPYGPWDAYLRYDPYFYGDPYRNWGTAAAQGGGYYYHSPNFGGHGWGLFRRHGCTSCGFWHASWLHGGWFRGHVWLHGGFGHKHKGECSTCGGVAVAEPATPTGDVTARYSGFGSPAQSAVFYGATPTLDPAAELVPTAGR